MARVSRTSFDFEWEVGDVVAHASQPDQPWRVVSSLGPDRYDDAETRKYILENCQTGEQLEYVLFEAWIDNWEMI
jgi:hypothetical protein